MSCIKTGWRFNNVFLNETIEVEHHIIWMARFSVKPFYSAEIQDATL